MLTQKQFYSYYTDYDVIITSMNEKLMKAQKNNPTMDFSSQLDTICKLRGLQTVFHGIHNELVTKENESGRVMSERENLLRRIQQLEKENEELKENIRL